MSKKVTIIGSGFAGLSAACHLAHTGHEVLVLEKNDSLGGRARQFEQDGFVFDMGPSWYWMPDVFEAFFEHFGKKVSDYYDLVRLDPSYRVWFDKKGYWDIPASMTNLEALFEQEEAGSAERLRKFLGEAQYKYEVGMRDFVHKPSLSILEFADTRIVSSLFRLQMFSSISKEIRRLFKSEKIIQLLEFPVLFLGATPQNTPALYSLMNYADLALGTWYPMGGMHKVVEGMTKLASELGVQFKTQAEARQIYTPNGRAKSVQCADGEEYFSDVVVGAADYHHIETKLLEYSKRNYSNNYWKSRTMAPSSLLYYVGLNKRLNNVKHHNLFFDEDFGAHAKEIYESPAWPEKPLFYACVPSVTDPSVAPEGHENLFLLIPVAPGLEDTPEIRERYFNVLMDRMEGMTGQSIRDAIVYKRSYAYKDFIKDYNSFKGNAYGLANTLLQTAFLKPKMRNKKVENLFYAGQLTVPGPGVPPSLISGEVVSKEVQKYLKTV